ncbi:MAG: LexA family protein [bacterium]
MRRNARITGIYALDGRAGEAIPLVQSFVPAGFPSPADDYVEKDLDLNEYLVRNPAATFFVRVAGDSMIGAGIHHGDILIVDRSRDAEPGRVVIAVVEGEMLVKRLRRLRGRLALLSENENFPPLELREGVDLAIWGVVTYAIHPL